MWGRSHESVVAGCVRRRQRRVCSMAVLSIDPSHLSHVFTFRVLSGGRTQTHMHTRALMHAPEGTTPVSAFDASCTAVTPVSSPSSVGSEPCHTGRLGRVMRWRVGRSEGAKNEYSPCSRKCCIESLSCSMAGGREAGPLPFSPPIVAVSSRGGRSRRVSRLAPREAPYRSSTPSP